ncbi:c-type cytochrome [Aquimarina muelleri]|uniref:Cytochrome c n=1 Tax=Aquimarina muelleri TaxID=279356 RepID=A0A918JV70_9FLAO|nr:cytochrome c [Aquimarina muelleri]MCX2761425.1 cytochrome c [Aquimarina muelleri]GGX13594.1 cytochrome c [Aquimarina muelleri]
MKNTIKILAVAVVMICFVSCKKDSKPNYQYMPNMYEPVSYEAYGEYGVFPGGQEAMLPAKGSIPRGWMPYDYENSNVGYQKAKDTLKNPVRYTKENEEKGKELYNIYCAICHGEKGDGKGPLVKREKILGVPSYADIGRAITEGSIYHVMYYGINSMGSYASQTNEQERWQIVQYVEKLKADLEGKTPRIDTDVVVTEVKEEEAHHDSTEEHNNAH